MNFKELVPAVEAVLFSGGEPMTLDRLCQVFEISPEELGEVIELLENKYNNADNGIKLVTLENAYQLTTKKEYAEYIKKAFDIKRKTPLSQAGFEVLAVVAYNQPVTKGTMDFIRGVDCTYSVARLLERGFIDELGRAETPGRPIIYGTTMEFLRCFGLRSLEDLPPLPEKEVIEQAAENVKSDIIEDFVKENEENNDAVELNE